MKTPDGLRILIIAATGCGGSASVVASKLEHGLSTDCTVELAAPCGDVGRLRPYRGGQREAARMSDKLNGFRPDMVIAVGESLVLARSLEVTRSNGLPAAWVATNPEHRWTPSLWPTERHRRSLDRRCGVAANLVLAADEGSKQVLMTNGAPRVELWAPGIDTVLFRPAKRSSSWRRSEGIDDTERALGCIVDESSAPRLDLIGALWQIPNTQVVVIGAGRHRKQLERRLPTARFVEPKSDEERASVVASLDLSVHTTSSAASVQSAREAMAAGVAVVGPRRGGFIGLIDHGRTGFLVEPLHAMSVRQAATFLARDEPFRRSMAEAASEGPGHRSLAEAARDLRALLTAATASKACVVASAA